MESTTITHGMEYQANLQTAIKLEKNHKRNGAVPATIYILQGKIHGELDKETLLDFSKSKNLFIKYSTRDIPYSLIIKKS